MGPTLSEEGVELKAPAYGLNDAPVAFHRALKRHLLNREQFMNKVGTFLRQLNI